MLLKLDLVYRPLPLTASNKSVQSSPSPSLLAERRHSMRRQQQELPLYAGYGAPPGQGYGTHVPSYSSTRRPVTQGSGSGAGRLPSIFDKPTGVVLPVGVHHQQEKGLGLDIKAMPAMGNLPVQTVPRLPQGTDRNMLSSSDTTSDRLRQAKKGYMPSGHSTAAAAGPGSVGGGELARNHGRRRFSQPNVLLGPPSEIRRGSNPLDQQQRRQLLSGHLQALEGSKTTMAASEPLPPIAVRREETDGSDGEMSGGVGVDQGRSESSISDSTDETDDEVRPSSGWRVQEVEGVYTYSLS